MASIDILTPFQLCRNPRVLKEALTLAKAGHEVRILNEVSRADFEKADSLLLQSAPFKREVILNHVGRDLRSRFRSVLSRCLTRSSWYFNRTGLGQLPYALGSVIPLRRAALASQAEVVFLHTETALWAGRPLLKTAKVVVADFEDWYSEDLPPQDRKGRPDRLLQKTEAEMLHQASFCMAPSQAMARSLASRYDSRPPHVVTNSFPLQKLGHRLTCSSEEPIRLFWFSQTVGRGRGLEEFIELWRKSSARTELTLLGEVSQHYCNELRSLAGIRSKEITFQPLVSPDELPDAIAEHHVGLALECDSIPSRNLTITNKILQYLNAGLAVIATPSKGQQEVFETVPGIGLLFESMNFQEHGAALDRFLTDYRQISLSRTKARKGAESHYSWERESSRLLAFVEEALIKKRNGTQRIL